VTTGVLGVSTTAVSIDPMADRQRIVIADSDPRRRRTTATLVRLGGYSVAEAERLAEIPQVARDGLDLLLTETQLIDGDGVAYAVRIRKNPPTASLPILVATIDRDAEPRVREALGEAAFLALPARPSELLGRIASLIGRAVPARR
jgi:CheY-like chemotaxis protein